MKPIKLRDALPIYRSRYAGKIRYRVRRRLGKRKYQQYAFTSRAQAEEAARELFNRGQLGPLQFADITPEDKFFYARIHAELRRQGIPVEAFYRKFKADSERASLGLGDNTTVTQFLERFLAREHLSGYHRRDLAARLGTFARAFCCPMHDVTPAMVGDWLDGLHVAPRTWNNYRDAIAALFTFAKAPFELPKKKLPEREIVILTPAQMDAYLQAANPQLRPCLALSAFAGIRTEEVVRMRCQHIHDDCIFLDKSIVKGKSGQRRARQIPLSENLRQWLRPLKGTTGVCPYKNAKSLSGMKWNLARRLGLSWERNALRSSWISYQLAITEDVGKVATWAGNSPKMIHDHYLKLATKAAAEEWFAIKPPAAQHVFPFDRATIRPKSVPSQIVSVRFA